MSCSPFDLRDYFLKELTDPQQRQVESHVKTCSPCREELDQLRWTGVALSTLGDEEMPQRIAFVSDKVFEPSPWRKAWSAFWGSGARLGFASAAMLSAAIIVFAVTRPAPIVSVANMTPPAPATVRTVSDADVQARVDAAVAKALASAKSPQSEEVRQLTTELQRSRQLLMIAADELDRSRKRQGFQTLRASGYAPPAESGEVQ